jgi:hypothetical protein
VRTFCQKTAASRRGIAAEIERDFGLKPNFESAKYQLEKADKAGQHFKATVYA